MTERRSDLIRDAAVGLTLAISIGSAAMTIIDRTTGSAKTAEQLDGRVTILEAQAKDQRVVLANRGSFVGEAANQINFLCATAPTCRQIYAPIVAPK